MAKECNKWQRNVIPLVCQKVDLATFDPICRTEFGDNLLLA